MASLRFAPSPEGQTGFLSISFCFVFLVQKEKDNFLVYLSYWSWVPRNLCSNAGIFNGSSESAQRSFILCWLRAHWPPQEQTDIRVTRRHWTVHTTQRQVPPEFPHSERAWMVRNTPSREPHHKAVCRTLVRGIVFFFSSLNCTWDSVVKHTADVLWIKDTQVKENVMGKLAKRRFSSTQWCV